MIPDEAVEAAARAMSGHPEGWDRLPEKFRGDYRDAARRILDAGAPYLVADAFEDAASAMSGAVVPVGYLLSCAKALRAGRP